MSKVFSISFMLLLQENFSRGAQLGQTARTVVKILTLSLASFSQPILPLHQPVVRRTMLWQHIYYALYKIIFICAYIKKCIR